MLSVLCYGNNCKLNSINRLLIRRPCQGKPCQGRTNRKVQYFAKTLMNKLVISRTGDMQLEKKTWNNKLFQTYLWRDKFLELCEIVQCARLLVSSAAALQSSFNDVHSLMLPTFYPLQHSNWCVGSPKVLTTLRRILYNCTVCKI